MLGGGFKHLEEQIKHRNTLKKCIRCNVLYNKTIENCPHCSSLSDADLSLQLNARKTTRLSMGKLMFIGAAAIILIMFIFKS